MKGQINQRIHQAADHGSLRDRSDCSNDYIRFDLLQVIKTEMHRTAATAILKISMALEYLTCCKSSKRKCTGQLPQPF